MAITVVVGVIWWRVSANCALHREGVEAGRVCIFEIGMGQLVNTVIGTNIEHIMSNKNTVLWA